MEQKLNPQQKNNLKKVLLDIGDSDDKQDMSVMEAGDIQSTLERNNKLLIGAITELAKSTYNMQIGFLKGLEGLKQSVEGNKQADWSGFFKDMPTLVTQLTESSNATKNTAEVIRNLKWNASQQLRDVNGSPINPAIAPFSIDSQYDEVQLSNYDTSGNLGTATYLQAGQIKSVLELTYDGDGNLIDVIRTV